MNRRQFTYVTTLGAAATGARGQRTTTPIAHIPEAAGLITEMVFLDDCVRLAMYDASLAAPFKTCLTSRADFVRNGALWRGSGTTPEATALSAGRAASESLYRHRLPDSTEARLYQDVALLRDIAEKAGCDPGKPDPVADLLDVLHVRRRLGLHTLNPDDEIHPWLEGIVTWWRDQRNLRAAIAAAYSAPDATKMRQFTAEFYRPQDPLIRLARGYEFAEVPPADAFQPALAQAAKGSGYARALAGAVESFRKMNSQEKMT
jgi:hypothetical protein